MTYPGSSSTISTALRVVWTGAAVVDVTDSPSDVILLLQPATEVGSGSGRLPVLKAPNDIHIQKASAVTNPTIVPCRSERVCSGLISLPACGVYAYSQFEQLS